MEKKWASKNTGKNNFISFIPPIFLRHHYGQWLQKMGVRVIPTISWAEPASFEYCFDGVETGGTVAVSTVGAKRNSYTIDLWKRGMTALIRTIAPTSILIYGELIDFNFETIHVKYFNNNILNHLHNL